MNIFTLYYRHFHLSFIYIARNRLNFILTLSCRLIKLETNLHTKMEFKRTLCVFRVSSSNFSAIDIGRFSRTFPVTPPYIRFRIRRFGLVERKFSLVHFRRAFGLLFRYDSFVPSTLKLLSMLGTPKKKPPRNAGAFELCDEKKIT